MHKYSSTIIMHNYSTRGRGRYTDFTNLSYGAKFRIGLPTGVFFLVEHAYINIVLL